MSGPRQYFPSHSTIRFTRQGQDYFVYTCAGDVAGFESVDEICLTDDALLLYRDGRLLATFDRCDFCFASQSLIEPFPN